MQKILEKKLFVCLFECEIWTRHDQQVLLDSCFQTVFFFCISIWQGEVKHLWQAATNCWRSEQKCAAGGDPARVQPLVVDVERERIPGASHDEQHNGVQLRSHFRYSSPRHRASCCCRWGDVISGSALWQRCHTWYRGAHTSSTLSMPWYA